MVWFALRDGDGEGDGAGGPGDGQWTSVLIEKQTGSREGQKEDVCTLQAAALCALLMPSPPTTFTSTYTQTARIASVA